MNNFFALLIISKYETLLNLMKSDLSKVEQDVCRYHYGSNISF